MKLTKKQQKFIKDAYNSNDVCSEWKTKIKENFPKLFRETELELNKWYKIDEWDSTIFVKEYKKGRVDYYGIHNDCWRDKDWADVPSWIEGLRPATKEEVEQALIAEAKKRGFKKNNASDVKCLSGFNEDECQEHYNNSNGNFLYESSTNSLWICGVSYLDVKIFENGKWAEIIETITKEQAEKELGKKIVG